MHCKLQLNLRAWHFQQTGIAKLLLHSQHHVTCENFENAGCESGQIEEKNNK